MKTGRPPRHWMLKGVASLSIQPLRTLVQAERSSAASHRERPLVGPSDEIHDLGSTAAAQPSSITRRAAESSGSSSSVFTTSSFADSSRKKGSDSSFFMVAVEVSFSPRTMRQPPAFRDPVHAPRWVLE